jgi:hypothetical protein
MYDDTKPSHLPPAHRLPTLNPTPEEVRSALEKVLAYNWADEMEDFNEHPDEDHIYLQLRVLHAHLYGPAH